MEEEKVFSYLQDNDIFAEVYYHNVGGHNVCTVLIEWGDWKHEHAYCDYLMEQIGYVKVGEIETEQDGSDCYSGEHFYIKNN